MTFLEVCYLTLIDATIWRTLSTAAKWSSGLMKKQHLVRQSDKSTNITVACCSASIIFSGCCLLMCVSDCLHARWRTLFLCPLSNLLSCWSMLSIVVKHMLFLVSVNVTGFHKCLHYFAFIAWAFCVCFSFLVCFCLFRWQFVEWVSLMKNCRGLYVFLLFFSLFFSFFLIIKYPLSYLGFCSCSSGKIFTFTARVRLQKKCN